MLSRSACVPFFRFSTCCTLTPAPPDINRLSCQPCLHIFHSSRHFTSNAPSALQAMSPKKVVGVVCAIAGSGKPGTSQFLNDLIQRVSEGIESFEMRVSGNYRENFYFVFDVFFIFLHLPSTSHVHHVPSPPCPISSCPISSCPISSCPISIMSHDVRIFSRWCIGWCPNLIRTISRFRIF